MTKKQITTTVEEAARLLRENPTWTYKKAIYKTKEMIGTMTEIQIKCSKCKTIYTYYI